MQYNRSKTKKYTDKFPSSLQIFPIAQPLLDYLTNSDNFHNSIFVAHKEFSLYSLHKIIRFIKDLTTYHCLAKNLIMIVNIFLSVLKFFYFLFIQC